MCNIVFCTVLCLFQIINTCLWFGILIPVYRLPNGSLMEITKVYPLDAVYDTPEDVPEDVSPA